MSDKVVLSLIYKYNKEGKNGYFIISKKTAFLGHVIESLGDSLNITMVGKKKMNDQNSKFNEQGNRFINGEKTTTFCHMKVQFRLFDQSFEKP